MENAHHNLGKSLKHRLLAMAELTDREMDDIIQEAVTKHLDEQEKALRPNKGFKDVLRSWSLEDLDLERVNGPDRADIEFDSCTTCSIPMRSRRLVSERPMQVSCNGLMQPRIRTSLSA